MRRNIFMSFLKKILGLEIFTPTILVVYFVSFEFQDTLLTLYLLIVLQTCFCIWHSLYIYRFCVCGCMQPHFYAHKSNERRVIEAKNLISIFPRLLHYIDLIIGLPKICQRINRKRLHILNCTNIILCVTCL